MVGINLDQTQNITDPAPLWRFIAYMPEIEGLRVNAYSVLSGDFSFAFVDSEARAHSGSYTYYPQFNNIDAIDLIFKETEDYRVTEYLVAWLNRVVNSEDGTYQVADYYKRTISLNMLDNQDREKIRIRYNGIFPTRINPINPSSDSEEYYHVSCSFSVDSNTIEFIR